MRIGVICFNRYILMAMCVLVSMSALDVAAQGIKNSESTLQLEKSKDGAEDFEGICKKIKNLLLSGEFRKYSVEYTQPEQGELEYKFESNGNNGPHRLQALCGNGSDAICEMTFFIEQGESFSFSLPASIRVILLDRQIYIINGVAISASKKIEARQYTVHKLMPNALLLVCNKF